MKKYTYVSVIYDDDIAAKTINEPSFYYLTDLEDIDIDDKVLVNRNGTDVVGIVIDVEIYEENKVPFPIEKTKKIIKILEKAEHIEEANNWEDKIINLFEPKKIKKEDFQKIKEKDVMFITNPGRMGDEDGTTFVVKSGNEFSVYRVDGWMYPIKKEKPENKITMAETANQFPKWLEAWEHGNEKDYKGKYTHIYTGFGNGLNIDNNIYEEYKPYLDEEVNKYLDKYDGKEEMKYAAVYNVWDNALISMVDDKGYILK